MHPYCTGACWKGYARGSGARPREVNDRCRGSSLGHIHVTRIAIIQGHPDPAGGHLLHAMADAYAEGAAGAAREVRRIEVAKLEFPLLRTQVEFEAGTLPPALVQPRDDMRWAGHWCSCSLSGTERCQRC